MARLKLGEYLSNQLLNIEDPFDICRELLAEEGPSAVKLSEGDGFT